MAKSNWDKTSIKTAYGSSYYDFGVIDYFDHVLECEIIDKILGARSDLSALDLAAGNGRFTEYLLQRGSKVTAVDLEEKHVKAIAERFPEYSVRAVLADAVQYAAETKEVYDVVIVSGLLLFLDAETADSFLVNIRKRLSKDGVCIIRDFVSHKGTLSMASGIFSGTTLYYRPQDFYSARDYSETVVARPLHHFPRVEKAVFGVVGYTAYKTVWTATLRALSWSRVPYCNRILSCRNSAA
jgi:2-polyprenyl-3-methyl-5-hydroxy-6-metoxy-1,4-benzoquinol methylase